MGKDKSILVNICKIMYPDCVVVFDHIGPYLIVTVRNAELDINKVFDSVCKTCSLVGLGCANNKMLFKEPG